LIHKVNRPASLSLVLASKQPENDPGASSGSGLSYDGSPSSESPSKNSSNEKHEDTEKKAVVLSLVGSVEQVGMTEVVKDFYENRTAQETSPAGRAGLSIKYGNDSSPAKGLLLNRKV
jgi:hypothetical protein